MKTEVKETGATHGDLKAVRLRYLDSSAPVSKVWIPKEVDVRMLEDFFDDALRVKEPEDGRV